ncbi:GWT1-domain-containing protein [Melanogaster broomeanus]|nr:GWT1-domain-containing protein [Melanogaster broomeanus]
MSCLNNATTTRWTNNYKASKEAFVSGMTGSTVTHVNTICIVALASIGLHSALRSRLVVLRTMPFIVEWLVLVTPLLLSMTLLLVPTCVLLLLPAIETGNPLPSKTNAMQPHVAAPSSSNNNPSNVKLSLKPLPALTTYRAHMMLMTILSILAVDFPVFPRSLAKCETFGVSLMDLGVGSFVFSQGVVSAIPLIKDPFHLTAPLKPKLYQITKKIAPIIVLGIVRVLLVKGTEYPEHVTEYGVHWNFFLTLAILPIAEVALHPIIKYMPIALLGLWIGALQEFALSIGGFKEFLLDAPRSNIIYANKEGLISLSGKTSAQPAFPTRTHELRLLLHSYDGIISRHDNPPTQSILFPQTANLFLEGEKDEHRIKLNPSAPRQNAKTLAELSSYASIWWVLLALVRRGLDVSRRMANLPYVLWIVAFNTSFILGYYLLDMLFFPTRILKIKDPSEPSGKRILQEDPMTPMTKSAPALLEALNHNGLVIFLAANVATGLVNLSIATMYVSNGKAMLILTGYSFGVSVFAWIFRNRRIWKM